MMNLVLKQVKQQPIDPLALNVIAAVDVDDTVEIGGAEARDDAISRRSISRCASWSMIAVSQGSGSAQAAGRVCRPPWHRCKSDR